MTSQFRINYFAFNINLVPRALFPGFGPKAREKRPGDEVDLASLKQRFWSARAVLAHPHPNMPLK